MPSMSRPSSDLWLSLTSLTLSGYCAASACSSATVSGRSRYVVRPVGSGDVCACAASAVDKQAPSASTPAHSLHFFKATPSFVPDPGGDPMSGPRTRSHAPPIRGMSEPHGRLGAVAHPELAVDRAGVLLDRVRGQAEAAGDLGVGGAGGEHAQDVA